MSSQKGLTLSETAIALLVIGIILVGFIKTRDVILQSDIVRTMRDLAGYEFVFNAFRDRYGSLPGDLPNAKHVLGKDAIDGNGDGYLGFYYQQGVVAWQHLSLAKLIDGNYPGTQKNAVDGACYLDECPLSRLKNLVYFPITLGISALKPPYGGQHRNGLIMYDGSSIDWGKGVDAQIAHRIDKKMDDGAPGTGLILGYGTGGIVYGDGWTDCAKDAKGTEYADDTGTNCRIFFGLK